MSIHLLKRVIEPPSSPSEAPGPSDWERANAKFGELPEDYREYLATYGTGSMGDFIHIFNPASSNQYLNLLYQAYQLLEAMREVQEFDEIAAEFPLHPEPGGLLPAGVTDNGNMIFWITRGKPSEWTILVSDARAPEYFDSGLGLVDFLAALMSGQLEVSVFPDDFQDEEPAFIPWKPPRNA